MQLTAKRKTRRTAGVYRMVVLGVLGCAGPPAAAVTVAPRTSAAPLEADGTCTTESDSFTVAAVYDDGRLTTLSWSEFFDATLEYQGERLVRLRVEFPTRRARVYEMTYDASGRLVRRTVQMHGVPDGGTTLATYHYDATGRLMTVQHHDDDDSYACKYEYSKGRLVRIVCDDEPGEGDDPEPTSYTYDAEGRVVNSHEHGLASTHEHDALGRVVVIRSGTDSGRPLVRTEFHYDEQDRLVGRRHYCEGRLHRVDRISYTGRFPAGFVCAGPPPAPPGFPDPAVHPWISAP